MHRRPLSSLSALLSLPVSVLVIAPLLLASVMAQGQTYIFGRTDIPVGAMPNAVAAGDFNGDGLTDLVVANTGDATVSVLLKRPDGSFAPQVTYATGTQPIAIITGDFNGDGNLDIAVTSENCTLQRSGLQCTPSSVSILLGNGDGTLQPHMDYPVGQLPSSLLVADFNGDGKLDLAVANAFDSTVSILLGNGDGTFQPQVVYSTANSGLWGSVVAGDFNGDGKLDLAVSCGSVVSVLLGNGDGTFKTHVDSGSGGASLAVGDFNRDGKLDLAVSGAGSLSGGISGGTLGILTGKGDGTFILTQQYSVGMTATATDLRGIGMVDLVLTGSDSYSASSVGIFLGNGDGTFQPAVNYGTGPEPVGAIATDLNGDGKLDLAVVNSACVVITTGCTGTVSILLGFGDGTFVGTTYYPASAGSGSVVSADFNNDGKLDFADAYGSVSVLLGNGDGTFQPQISYSTGVNADYLATADFRNNGIMDLVTANNSANTISVLLGNGDGTFQSHVDYTAGLGPHGVAVGDFTGNGKLDLAVTDISSASVAILLGNGDGTFQSPVGYITGSSPEQVATGDFNQDGKLDLAVTYNPGVSILLGNGDGTFAGHVDYPVAAGAFAIATGDFNGDGKLDLAIGGEGGVSILLGNGDGTFQPPVSDPAVGASISIVVTDFNQDGKLDLAVSTETNQDLILLGNGDGTFQPPIPYLFISGALAVGDFNGDGAPDWAGGDANNVAYRMGIMVSAAFKSVTPGSLNFGSQGVGTTSAAQTITISNPSNVKIKISSLAATGNFAQTNDCGAELALGANCTVNVTFYPTIVGPQSGTITLTDNTRISPLAIPLTGTGVNGSFLTPYPSRVPFPTEPVGTSSLQKVVTLVNTGNASLIITQIAASGDFAETNTCNTPIAVGGNCQIAITFTPTTTGHRAGGVTISNNASGSPQTIPLSGLGVAAPDFSISSSSGSSTSQTISAGQTASFSLAFSSIGSFTGTVNLSCTVTPAATPAPTCNLSSSSVQISGSGTQTVTVKVGTTAPVTSWTAWHKAFPPTAWPLTWAFLLFGSAGLLVGTRKRRFISAVPATLFLLFSVSCGGSSSPTTHTSPGTPAGTYTATITANSGSLSHTMPLQVVVQ